MRYYSRVLARSKYLINDIELHTSISFALLTDIHDHDVEIESLEKYDFVVISGDFVLGKNYYNRKYGEPWTVYNRNAEKQLKSLTAVMPVYLTLGNHEWAFFDYDIDIIRDYGVTVLDNEYVTTPDGLIIGGLTSGISTNYRIFDSKIRTERNDYDTGNYHFELYHHGETDYELNTPEHDWLDQFEKADGYRILISHHPEYWDGYGATLNKRNIDLVLSGHAHGGQIRLFNKGLYAPGQGWLPKYTKGIYEGEYGKMIVSAGMSNTSRIPRFFNPTEIVEVNLIPKG